MNKLLAARCLFTINAAGLAFGGFIADWNDSHIFNPNWPPHAKFHNGQTLAFGVLMAAATLFFAWRRSGDRRTNILAAAITGGATLWAQAAAYAVPGVAWTDPQFLKPGQSLDDFGPQIYFEMLVTFVIILASWLAWPSKADEHLPRPIGIGDPLGDRSPLSPRQRISALMKKVQYSRYGGPEELRLDEVALPTPMKGQVRVQVRAASLNPMDWKIRRGEMKALTGFRFPRGLGHDFAGVVEAVGSGVSTFKAGDEVIGVTSIPKAGAMADYVIADAKNLWIKPASVPFVEAAALTIVGLTAWNALIAKAKLSAGQAVFINGCLGGVGRSAVQIARVCGASIAGSCSIRDFGEARAQGVGEAVDYRSLDVRSLEHRFDVVFDTVGTLSLQQCAAMLKPGGMSLHIVPSFGKWIGSLLSRRHHLIFGNPTPESLAGITDAAERCIIVPVIGRTVPLSEAIPVITELEKTGLPKGKLVIAPE